MKFNRRKLLAGASAVAAYSSLPKDAKAWLHPGQQLIGHGWNTLPLGAGGDLWGLHVANDGSIVTRGDVFGAFVWSGTSAMASLTDGLQKWSQVLNFSSFGISNGFSGGAGPWEYVQAPGNSNYHYLVTGTTDSTNKYTLYYSTNKGLNFTASNITVSAASQIGPKTEACYKVAVDPNNEKIVYWGMPQSNGNATSVYTTFDRALGHTWPTFTGAFTDAGGTTLFPQCSAGNISAVSGIVFDTSLGTTTINGQTVTKRIIIPVGGQGIFESTDGGVSFTNIAPAAFTGSTYVYQGFLDGDVNANGVNNYFCTFLTSSKAYRYVGGGVGGWKDITPAGYTPYGVIVDPRPGAYGSGGGVGYLTLWDGNGIAVGFTSTNSTATTPTWGGATGGQTPTLNAASYDIGYMNHIFGTGAFTDGHVGIIDSHGTCVWCGNQSVWYFSSPPNWALSKASTSWSFGRGQEAVVGVDMICPPGGTYPILAPQDVGSPMIGNTFIKYPTDLANRGTETTCQNLDYAADDPSFIVARMTGQASTLSDVSKYTNDYGVTWTGIADTPTALWQTVVTGSTSGTTLTVTAITSGTQVWFGSQVRGGANNNCIVQSQLTGTPNGIGTYQLSETDSRSGTINLDMPVPGGQTVAADRDHWVTCPNTPGGFYIPAYTTNARTTASWALCNGLPALNWVRPGGGWSYGITGKPFAVGYGTDLGVVWAAGYDRTTGIVTLYRSTDSGANFSSIGTVTGQINGGGVYLLSVPGFPNELWLGINITSGSSCFWRISNANTATATFTAQSTPTSPIARSILGILTLGAPASPGGYPFLYGTFEQNGMGQAPHFLYQGTWNGSSVSWSLYGPTGAVADLPQSNQFGGFGSLRGDWNVPGRIYNANNAFGYAYYNP